MRLMVENCSRSGVDIIGSRQADLARTIPQQPSKTLGKSLESQSILGRDVSFHFNPGRVAIFLDLTFRATMMPCVSYRVHLTECSWPNRPSILSHIGAIRAVALPSCLMRPQRSVAGLGFEQLSSERHQMPVIDCYCSSEASLIFLAISGAPRRSSSVEPVRGTWF